MPRRETRYDIEREMAAHRRDRSLAPEDLKRLIATLEGTFERMRKGLDPAQIARMRAEFDRAIQHMRMGFGRKRRRPDDGGMPRAGRAPRGPKPLAGGAAAPLEFD
jgi:hypothetical protein